MKISKNLKKNLTLPNFLFVLASLMVLSIICKDSMVEGFNALRRRGEVDMVKENTNYQGSSNLPLGVVIAIIVIVIIIGVFFMKK
tara:strand:- start:2735 stop:2989 length:255 start_codon:yes stop_codon:yes gene_type:complete